MKMRARLNVRDGRVLCPSIAGWRAIEDCADCPSLRHIETAEQGETVVCVSSVAKPSATLSELVRA